MTKTEKLVISGLFTMAAAALYYAYNYVPHSCADIENITMCRLAISERNMMYATGASLATGGLFIWLLAPRSPS